MNVSTQELFSNMTKNVIGYLPDLFAGIVLVLIGWLLGWIAKRVIIQIAVILRLERYFERFQWGQYLGRADIRYGFYGFLGNIIFLIVFLIFLNDAFSTWKLTVLSTVLEKGILFFPKLIIALLVFGFGWLVSLWTSRGLLKALRREDIPRASLISRFFKGILLLFFFGMALAELNIAREVVIIGFATIFITLGAVTIVLASVGGKQFFEKIRKPVEEE